MKLPKQKLSVWQAIGRLSGGGAETQVRLLCNNLSKRGLDIKLLYVFEQNDQVTIEAQVDVLFISRTSKWRWWEIFKAVGGIMDEQKPDVVHVWLPEIITIPVAFEAKKRGIPVISSVRRSTFKGVRGINLVRDALGLVPHLLSRHVVSNFSLEHEPWIAKFFLRGKSTSVIPNGVDCQNYGAERKQNSANFSLRLCFVGRFATQKRLEFLIQSLSNWKDRRFTLDVFGRGSKESEKGMRLIVNRLGLGDQVNFCGFVKNWRVHSGNFDILVFPSVSEGMPNVIMEAMSEGLLVIASDIPEISSLITHGENGLLFEKDNSDELLSLLDEVSKRFPVEIANRGRAFSNKFSPNKMADKYLQLYESFQTQREISSGS